MASTPTYKNLSALIEQPNSGGIKYSDRKQVTKIYKGLYADCEADALAKGTAGSGALTGFLVSESTVVPERGGLAVLTIVWESGGSDGSTPLPPDEVGVQPDNAAPRTERAVMFRPLDTQTVGTEAVMDIVFAAVHAQNKAARDTELAKLSGNTLALKLVEKIRQGNESFYLASLRYVWATHYYALPTMTRGGYIDSPGGPLAGYFVSDIAWLREGDDLQYSNGVWRLTRSWLGTPNGHWDSDLYS